LQQSDGTLLKQLLQVMEREELEDFLKEMVEQVCQELLELEITEHLRAQPYERTEERVGYRNGYKPRRLHTRVGTLELRVPQDREGRFSPSLFARYQRSEKALLLALQEMYLQGVSTRKVRKITEQLCGTEFSKDQVSAVAQQLDEQLEAWRIRPLGDYPYLIIDAKYEKIREDGQVRSEGVLIIKGVRAEGKREILAVEVANTENETTWSEVFRDLKRRGLSGVRCIVSDDHEGLGQAIDRYFQGVAWQRCQVHYLKNATDKVSSKERSILRERLKDAWAAPDCQTAQSRLEQIIEDYRGRYPELADWLEETGEETLTVFELPKEHRKRMRSTNGLERFHQELERRTRVVRIFPNRASCLRLMSALAMEQSEEWLTGRRYLDMSLLERVSEVPQDTEVVAEEVVMAVF
jgi:putative transposase